jgi:DNA polymerase III gamma/tau subunit
VLASASKNGKKQEINKEEIEAILGYVDSKTVDFFLASLVAGEREKALGILGHIYEQGLNPLQFLREVLEAARVKLVIAIKEKSKQLRIWLLIIKELNQASIELKTSLVAILPIEVAIINITETDLSVENDQVLKKTPVIKSLAPKIQVTKSDNTEAELVSFIDIINTNWTNILQEAKKYNHFLTAILTNSGFSFVKGEGIVVKVATSFHKKQLDSPETHKILDKIIASFCGKSVPFNCIIDAGLKVQNVKNSNAKLVEELLL